MIKTVKYVIVLWAVLAGMVYGLEARFAGMGNISLLYPDEYNKYELYDFAAIPAALIKYDTVSWLSIRASGLQETWQHDSLKYLAIGQPIPPKLADYIPLEAASALYTVIPAFSLTPTDFVYSSCQSREKTDDFGNVTKPQAWRFYGGYGQLDRSYIGDAATDNVKTPAFAAVYARPITENITYGLSGDIFYGMFNSADAEDKATLFPIGGGGGIAYDKGDIAAGVNVEYHYPMFDFSETFGNNTYTESFKGNAVSPSAGFLVTKKNIKWVSAVNYKWMSLNGRSDTFALGDLTSSGYSAKTRLLFVPGPVRAAAFIQYDNRTTEYADEQGNLWFDAVYQTYAFGAGTGWGTKKLTVGLEGGLQINTINNRLDTLSSTSQALFGKAGLEYAVMKDLYLRGGYNFDQVDPDLEGSSDRTKTHTVTGGVGLNIISGMRLDIAYNYRMGKTQLLPDENITDHILLVYFRYILKESSGNF